MSTTSIFLWCKVTFLIAAAFVIYPSALGGQYTYLGLFLLTAALSLYLFEALLRSRIRISKNSVAVIISGTALWSYLVVQAVMVGSEGVDFVLKAGASNITSICVYGLLLGDVLTNKTFFRVFTIILAVFSASALTTAVLSLLVPLNSLYIGHIPVEGYDNVGDVYFPFSLRHGSYPIGGTELPRLAGFFQEAGILQAFLLWGVVYALNERFPKWIAVLMLFGVVTSLSTAGVALLPATLLLWITLKTRVSKLTKAALGFVSGVVVVAAFLYTPAIGILDKSELRGTSYSERLELTVTGLASALDNPFGVGMYGLLDVKNAGVNLLAAMSQIGVLGFLLAIMVFMAPLIRNSNRTVYIVAVLPIFITSLLSQPLINAPLVYVMLFAYFTPTSKVTGAESRTVRTPRRPLRMTRS